MRKTESNRVVKTFPLDVKLEDLTDHIVESHLSLTVLATIGIPRPDIQFARYKGFSLQSGVQSDLSWIANGVN